MRLLFQFSLDVLEGDPVIVEVTAAVIANNLNMSLPCGVHATVVGQGGLAGQGRAGRSAKIAYWCDCVSSYSFSSGIVGICGNSFWGHDVSLKLIQDLSGYELRMRGCSSDGSWRGRAGHRRRR